ncbi:MAG: efflux RND transporter periplasmic adaptor subunit [Gemmatimonadota bacterium]|nr:efflux RND transporter periplasmic adaptor subunit [Gemmatimonadota bacterium]
MPNHSRFALVAILVVGILLTVFVLRSESGGDGPEEAAEAAGYPKGPHGGRLLSDGPLQLEVTIYEDGVPPQFRVFPYDSTLTPLDPATVELEIALERLGGRVDQFRFRQEGDYLRGDAVVLEPHSFDVRLTARLSGRTFQWSYSQIEGKVELAADQRKSAGITIDTVGPRLMETTLVLPGEITEDATRRAQIAARLDGVVTEVFKQEGDRVRRGELVAVLSSRELAHAKSGFLAAAHHLEFTRVTLAREDTLWSKRISAERDLLEARQGFDEATLALRLAEQSLIALGIPASELSGLADAPPEALARYEIRAPLNGTVTERQATIGEAVRADTRLFTISDLSSVWVNAAVYPADLSAVRNGQAATILSAELGQEATGRVSFVGPLVGQESRAATARIVLPNADGRWRPGLFVSVRLVRESVRVPLAVAVEAIQTFRDWQVVFVRHGDWFEARPLELGRTDGTWIEVRSGLAMGDQYARQNSFAVKAEIGKLGATHDH